MGDKFDEMAKELLHYEREPPIVSGWEYDTHPDALAAALRDVDRKARVDERDTTWRALAIEYLDREAPLPMHVIDRVFECLPKISAKPTAEGHE